MEEKRLQVFEKVAWFMWDLFIYLVYHGHDIAWIKKGSFEFAMVFVKMHIFLQ